MKIVFANLLIIAENNQINKNCFLFIWHGFDSGTFN